MINPFHGRLDYFDDGDRTLREVEYAFRSSQLPAAEHDQYCLTILVGSFRGQSVIRWYQCLPEDVRSDWNKLKVRFQDKYGLDTPDKRSWFSPELTAKLAQGCEFMPHLRENQFTNWWLQDVERRQYSMNLLYELYMQAIAKRRTSEKEFNESNGWELEDNLIDDPDHLPELSLIPELSLNPQPRSSSRRRRQQGGDRADSQNVDAEMAALLAITRDHLGLSTATAHGSG